MARENRKNSSFNFGYTVTLLLLLLLAAGAVLLLIPSYREYRKKKQLEANGLKELDLLREQRTQERQTNDELNSSRKANEKIGREKFNLVEKGDLVMKYKVKEQGK